MEGLTYLIHGENLIDRLKLVRDVVAVTSNLFAESLCVEIVRDLQVLPRRWNALDLAHSKLRSLPLEAIFCLASEKSCLQRQQQTLIQV